MPSAPTSETPHRPTARKQVDSSAASNKESADLTRSPLPSLVPLGKAQKAQLLRTGRQRISFARAKAGFVSRFETRGGCPAHPVIFCPKKVLSRRCLHRNSVQNHKAPKPAPHKYRQPTEAAPGVNFAAVGLSPPRADTELAPVANSRLSRCPQT